MPPRLAKLLAALAALAMVGGALWVRARDGGDDGGPGDDGATGDPIRVVCVTELEEICRKLAPAGIEVVAVEEAGKTADRLGSAPGDDLDAWVTIDPWPEMVDVVREGNSQDPLFAEPIRAASSDLVLMLQRELDPSCGWNCVVDQSDQQAEIGVPGASVALGPLVVANAFSSHLGTVDFSTAEIDDERRWLELLVAAGPSRDAERRMATEGPAAYLAAGTTEQRADPPLRSPQGVAKGLKLGQPELNARADVVVAPLNGRDVADRLKGIFTRENALQQFTDDGWTAPAADGATGLPAADLLVALREEIGT